MIRMEASNMVEVYLVQYVRKQETKSPITEECFEIYSSKAQALTFIGTMISGFMAELEFKDVFRFEISAAGYGTFQRLQIKIVDSKFVLEPTHEARLKKIEKEGGEL